MNFVNENLWNIREIPSKHSLFNYNNTFYEKVDLEYLNLFLKSSYEKIYDERWCEQCNVPFNSASSHVKRIKKKLAADELRTKTRGSKIGRVYFNNFASLSTLPNEIRALLSMRIYTDFDIENVQPSLLHQICVATGIPQEEYENLTFYCTNRSKSLRKMAKLNFNVLDGDTRSIVKFIFIACCFFGMSADNCAAEVNLSEINGFDELVAPLKREVQRLFKKYVLPNNLDLNEQIKLEKQREYETACATARKRKVKLPAQPKSSENSLMSKFLQHYERLVVESILTELMSQGKISKCRFVYMYDGFQLESAEARNITLEELQEIGENHTGLKVKWTTKAFTKGERLLEILLKEQEEINAKCIHPANKLKLFDMKYFNSLSGDYVRMKSYFEHFHKYVLNPQPYVYLTQTVQDFDEQVGEHVEKRFNYCKTKSQIEETFEGFVCNVRIEKQGNSVVAQKPFTKIWFEDTEKDYKDRVDFLPENKPFGQIPNTGHVLNTFTGYPTHVFGERIPHAEVLKEVRKFLVLCSGLVGDRHPMQYHVEQVVDNTYSPLNQFLHLVAHTIKYPKRKLPYSVCIRGPQGTGKNTVLNVFANIIGKEHYLSSSKPKDLFGDHASTFVNKLIINLNEIDFMALKEYDGMMKALITEPTIVVNEKYMKPRECKNFAFIVATGNGRVPIIVDVMAGDRRWLVFESSNANTRISSENWEKLHTQFNTHYFQKCMYQFLMSLDVEHYNFKQSKRVNTQSNAYNAVASSFIKPELLFLREFIYQFKYYDYIANKKVPEWVSNCLRTDAKCYVMDSDGHEEDHQHDGVEENLAIGCDIIPTKYFYDAPEFYKTITINCKELFSDYKEWLEQFGGTEHKVTLKQFKSKLLGLGVDGLTIATTRSRNQIFNFNAALITHTFRVLFDENPSDWNQGLLGQLIAAENDINELLM